jgi:SAM-dependent methyltransferase
MESADSWAAGAAYESYMGRWSRDLARVFLEWLGHEPSQHWLDFGCGTGALTAAICDLCRPASVAACDPSAQFIEYARTHVTGPCTFSVLAGDGSLPEHGAGFDAIVSGLVLNFVPEPARALSALRARARSGGRLAFYVWDYSGGIEFLGHFWEQAVALDPGAAALDESRRFGGWHVDRLASLLQEAGLVRIETSELEIPTEFSSFDDYWRPFLGGSGPAPSYVASLEPDRRQLLETELARRLAVDGPRIRLRARAAAACGVSA